MACSTGVPGSGKDCAIDAASKGQAKTAQASSKVQILDDIVNSDFTAARNEYYFRTPVLVDLLLPLLKDQRDVPMLCLLLNIAEILLPGVAIVFAVNLWMPELSQIVRHATGLGYQVARIVLFQYRFTLCIHFAAHRPIFRHELLNAMVQYVYAPFFGVPPGIYKLHHLVMHHVENNHEKDASSTEEFQRDSWFDFCRYWYRFLIQWFPDLIYFTVTNKKWHWLSSTLTSVAVWIVLVYTSATRINFVATLWVFVIPHILCMTFFAFGNWSQHIFVNPTDRHSNYALTYNILDSPSNQETFNDGYHIVHHINSRLHWTEIPQYFYDDRERHIRGGALTFRNISVLMVGLLAMTGQVRKLAERHYVHLGPKETAPTFDEVEAKLIAWLKPCPRNEPRATGSAKKE